MARRFSSTPAVCFATRAIPRAVSTRMRPRPQIRLRDGKSLVYHKRPHPILDPVFLSFIEQKPQRFAGRLVREIEGPVMHRDQKPRPGIDEGLDSVRRTIVIRLHKPARFICSDSNQKIIYLRKKLARLAVMTTVSAVAAEVHGSLVGLNNVSAPQPPVGIEKPATRPVPYWKKVNSHRLTARSELLKPARCLHRVGRSLPFVQHVVGPETGKKFRVRKFFRDRTQGRFVHVVAMVVREQDVIDAGEVLEL